MFTIISYSFAEKSVEVEIQELENSFKEIHKQLTAELMEKKVSVETLLQTLTLLPISCKNEYEATIQKLLPDVEGKKTIPELLFRLNPLFTFIDYNLPEYLVSEFGSEELKSNMKLYVKEVAFFMKTTTVGELMHYWPGREICPEYFSILFTKISDDPKTYTLEKLNELRRSFCSMLRLSEVLFNLMRIEASSSFIVVWVIPNGVVSTVSEIFSRMDKSFFTTHHILKIILDKKQVYSIEDKVRRLAQSCLLSYALHVSINFTDTF